MSRGKISFGKISADFAKNAETIEATGSFGTYTGVSNPIQMESLEEDFEKQNMKETVGITSFGKKAKSFDIQVRAVSTFCVTRILRLRYLYEHEWMCRNMMFRNV